MKRQHLFEHRLFSTTQQNKDDVIGVLVTSSWICFLLPLRDFVPLYYHAKFDGNWTANKAETEGGGGTMRLLVPKHPSLNRVKESSLLLTVFFSNRGSI